MLTNRARYLDRLNFATNFVFFRDADGLSTRLTTANYWAGYGAARIRLWLRLFDEAGAPLATWEQPVPAGPGGIVIDSREVRARFGLPPFTGQLLVHAIGVAGHDVVKYALDTYAGDNGASLSCTHDANAWPSDRYAGLPAPREDERVVLVGAEQPRRADPGRRARARPHGRRSSRWPLDRASRSVRQPSALDVAELLPGLRWPAQIEVRAGRHVVRPRYEVTRGDRTRIAHVNVERADLKPDPGDSRAAAGSGGASCFPFRCSIARVPHHRAADADG